MTYDAYDGYWGTKALTPKAILRWNKEAAQRLVELQAGTVDGIDNVGPTDFATVEGDSNLQLKPRTGLNVFYLGFNNTFKPWDNEAVRQAIAKGIDRKRIVDTFYPGGSTVADYFTPCDIANGCVGPKWYDFDAAAAKAGAHRRGLRLQQDLQAPLPAGRPRLPARSARHRDRDPGRS